MCARAGGRFILRPFVAMSESLLATGSRYVGYVSRREDKRHAVGEFCETSRVLIRKDYLGMCARACVSMA